MISIPLKSINLHKLSNQKWIWKGGMEEEMEVRIFLPNNLMEIRIIIMMEDIEEIDKQMNQEEVEEVEVVMEMDLIEIIIIQNGKDIPIAKEFNILFYERENMRLGIKTSPPEEEIWISCH
jgi:hypothetical protein